MRLAVYGLGKLGYPLASVLARAFPAHVVGIDKDMSRITNPPAYEPDIEIPPSFGYRSEPVLSDVSFVVVPTPSNPDGSFSDSLVKVALEEIIGANESGHTIVLVSTVSPGTCSNLAAVVEKAGMKLVYNPTLIALGQVVKGLVSPDLLMYGTAHESLPKKVHDVWTRVFQTYGSERRTRVHYGSYVEIELLKLSINCALTTKISLANQLGMLFESYNVDPHVVSVIGSDHRIGPDYFTPGWPFGGPCFPRDNRALQAAAWRVDLPLSDATEKVNGRVVNRLAMKVDSVGGHRAADHRVAILGLEYKYGTGVTDGSVGRLVADRLEGWGWKVATFDRGDSIPAGWPVVFVTHTDLLKLIPDDYAGTVVTSWE